MPLLRTWLVARSCFHSTLLRESRIPESLESQKLVSPSVGPETGCGSTATDNRSWKSAEIETNFPLSRSPDLSVTSQNHSSAQLSTSLRKVVVKVIDFGLVVLLGSHQLRSLFIKSGSIEKRISFVYIRIIICHSASQHRMCHDAALFWRTFISWQAKEDRATETIDRSNVWKRGNHKMSTDEDRSSIRSMSGL